MRKFYEFNNENDHYTGFCETAKSHSEGCSVSDFHKMFDINHYFQLTIICDYRQHDINHYFTKISLIKTHEYCYGAYCKNIYKDMNSDFHLIPDDWFIFNNNRIVLILNSLSFKNKGTPYILKLLTDCTGIKMCKEDLAEFYLRNYNELE